jgi:hypothetical protein
MTLAKNGLLKAIEHIECIKTSVENQDRSQTLIIELKHFQILPY